MGVAGVKGWKVVRVKVKVKVARVKVIRVNVVK